MKNKGDSVRTPKHIAQSRTERRSSGKSVGAALMRARKILLMRRIIVIFLLLVLVGSAVYFAMMGYFDSMIRLLVREIA